jgi:hypothetical protein
VEAHGFTFFFKAGSGFTFTNNFLIRDPDPQKVSADPKHFWQELRWDDAINLFFLLIQGVRRDGRGGGGGSRYGAPIRTKYRYQY